MSKLMVLTALLLSLSACTVTPSHGGRVVLKDGTVIQSSGSSNGNFCPPGQAKKGRC